MEAYIWLILASMLGVGVVFGFFMGRSKGDTSAPKVLELEQNLRDTKEEMQSYQSDVTHHFEKTATLVNQLTNSYREVYEHLATSSEKLCGGQVPKLASLAEETKVLEGQGETVESSEAKTTQQTQSEPVKETAEEKVAEEAPVAEAKAEAPNTPEAETTSEPEAPAEAESKSDETVTAAEAETPAEEKKGNGSSEEPIIQVSETVAAAEKQPEESRTIH